MAQTLGITIRKASDTKIIVNTGRIGGWNEDVPTLMANMKLNINGTDISPDGGNQSGYDANGVIVAPFVYLTHYFSFTVPSGTTSGTLKYKDTSSDSEQSISFSGVASTTQIQATTSGRFRLEYKSQSNLRICPSGSNAVAQDTTTNSQVSHQLNHLGNNIYQLQHVTTGLCLASGGGSESVGQQCIYKASDTNDATQKFTVEPNGAGGVIIRFVSNPSRSLSVSSGNLVLANYSANSSNLAWLFQTIEDTTAVSGGSGINIVLINTGVTSSSAALDWNEISGVSTYNVFRTTDLNNWPSTPLFGQGQSIVNNTGLNPSTTYYYKITVVIGGQTYTSNIVTVTTSDSGGGTTTGTPTISDNALGVIWDRQELLSGNAAANSTIRIYNGTTLLKTVTADSTGAWKWDLLADKTSQHLPITTQLNATAQLSGQNVSSPCANKTVTTTPSTAFFAGVVYTNISQNSNEYKAEEVAQNGGTYIRKNPPIQYGTTQSTLQGALNIIDTTFNN